MPDLSQEFTTLPVDALEPHPDNPRRGDVDAIAESIDHNGFYGAIIAQRRGDGAHRIIAGEHRWRGAQKQGMAEVPVMVLDVGDAAALRIMLADNRTTDLAGYDEAALAEVLGGLAGISSGMGGTGYGPGDLDDLLGRLTPGGPGSQPGDDLVPDQPQPHIAQGDVWLLGPHRMMCGDATSTDAMRALMGGEQADLVWTDPPYGVSYVGKTADALTIKNDDDGLELLLRDAFTVVASATTPGAGWYVTAPSGPQFQAFGQVLGDLGVWRQTLVWVKNSMVLGHSDYHYRHEAVVYGWTPGAAHHPPEGRTHDTVLEFDRPPRSAEHPTMKPIALIVYCIENSSAPGAVVLDPFAGSGSTVIAAERTNRVARVMEIDARYCDVICARYQRITGTPPVHEPSGEPHDFLSS